MSGSRCPGATVNNDVTHTDGQTALMTAQQVARSLGCSVRHVYRLADRGAMPRPVRLGSLVRWRRTEIDQWIDLGCPAHWMGDQR